jgi:hypothetical protein
MSINNKSILDVLYELYLYYVRYFVRLPVYIYDIYSARISQKNNYWNFLSH